MARNEGRPLRRWVDYYAGEVGNDNVFVVDDNSEDGSTENLPCAVLRIPHLRKERFENSRMALVSGLAAGLLAAFDAVLFCDGDEFVVADPLIHPSLRHFVAARTGRTAVGVLGLNVVHDVGREAALDESLPILGQRQLAKFLPRMCKPSLKWEPVSWARASHGLEARFEIDPELYMFHMKFADRDRLAVSAADRHRISTTEGRSRGSSWALTGEDMVSLLTDITSDVDRDGIPTFEVPSPERRAAIVKEEADSGTWKASGEKQEVAMRKRRLVRIPERFHGLV